MSVWETVTEEFDAVSGVWLDTAHQGPLPRRAAGAVREATTLKADPARMTDEAFSEVPEALRGALARLVGASPEEIVLGNSTSYGLHLVANGLDWAAGDEVITVKGDYPATVLPWCRLEEQGLVRKEVGRRVDGLVDSAELESTIGPQTRVVAVTWVDSFTGVADDITAIGKLCRQHDVLCVVNGSQAVGARAVDVTQLGVDALVSCGYKWLCGPYGTGFAWLAPALRDRLTPRQAYWLANPAGSDLKRMRDHTLRHDLGVRGFDVFCTANFLNFDPWLAAIDLIHELGPQEIERHDQALVDRLVDGLDREKYVIGTPADRAARSTLVVLDRRDGDTDATSRRLTDAGIATSLREGSIRLSPHLFNTENHIDQALTVLDT